MISAILGFEYVHGTYPQPTEADPDETRADTPPNSGSG